jgi:hypothetical protein
VNTSIERIFVVLDAAVETTAAIAAAVELAARLKAPLRAVFVEREDLMNVAGLPVARHIVPGSGTVQLTGADLELHWRAAAARARNDLRTAAKGQALEYSFEVMRGTAEAALAAVEGGELVVAGARTRPFAGHFRVQLPWLAALETLSGAFLLAREEFAMKGGVVVLLREHSPAAARLLRTAVQLAELGGTRLTVIAPPALAEGETLRNWIVEQLESALPLPEIESAPAETPALARRIRELDCRVLAVNAGTTERERLAEITERFTCDVLVVR